MDMSGSMRQEGQYINVKRMALALDGLIRSEYPGDFLQFVEMYTFAKQRRSGEIVNLMPKPVTIHDPVVRLKADMSRADISEMQIPPHFTNVQHGLQLCSTDVECARYNQPPDHSDYRWLAYRPFRRQRIVFALSARSTD